MLLSVLELPIFAAFVKFFVVHHLYLALGVPVAHLVQYVYAWRLDLDLSRYPGVIFDLLSVHAVSWVCYEHLLDKVLRLGAYARPFRSRQVIFALFNLLEKLEVVVMVEGRLSAQQNKKHNADAPEVAAFFVGLFGENFGCNIAGRTAGGCCISLIVDESR